MSKYLIWTAVLLLLLSSLAIAQTGQIQLDVKRQTLPNGLRILVLENHSSPVFSAIIRFNTGSLDERPGLTGVSHLLEHMLFKGTKIFGTSNYKAEVPIMNQIDSLAHLIFAEQVKLNSPLYPNDSTRYKELRGRLDSLQMAEKKYIIKDELWSTFLQNGGTGLNASTGNDGTQYYVSLPKNRLELWALMESDRMANMVLREFYSERDVVMEERRLGENSPWGSLGEALNSTIYWASPYDWPVVGWMSDLHMVMREDVEAYFKAHYSPSNAVVAIVGDVDANEVFKICSKYFSAIPSQPLPRPVVTSDAPQRGERRTEIEYDANPMAMVAWNTPEVGDSDIPALDFAANILSNGRTSRFYKNIKEKKLGDARASMDNMTRNPGTFSCVLTPTGDHTVAEMETAAYAEIDRLKTEKVSDWELEKVRNQIDAGFIRSLQSNRGMAFRLSSSEAITGDWHYFLNYREALKKVTADDIMRVVNKYLVKSNRSVAYIVRTKGASDEMKKERQPRPEGPQ
ncbi:conserved exported hypothetical protein [Candidatus Zixiibacteriota bacterium]|nr:conserved exported hypothetical protein [candidate division Zixibacteria bacterium]